MTQTLIWVIVPLLLLAAALLMLRSARLQTEVLLSQPKVEKRLTRRTHPSESLVEWLQAYLFAAGIALSPRSIVLLGGLLLVILTLVLTAFGANQGPLLIVIGLLLINTLLSLRAAHLRQQVRQQLAPFMEQIMRDVGSGQTLERGFRRAAERAGGAIGSVMARVLYRRDLGLDLDEALTRESRILKLYELNLLATTIRIHQFHGGSLRDILGSLVALLRQQDRSRRELRAMTGETRVSAWVLVLAPLFVIAVIWLMSPGFFQPMLESGGGRMALMLAVLLQVFGIFWIFRMLRSA